MESANPRSDDLKTGRLLLATAILGALGVVIGAFGAHGLPDYLERLGCDAETIQRRGEQLDVGVRYHLIHVVAVLCLPGCSAWVPRRALRRVGWLFLVGIFFFSGSLYLLVSLNQPKLGMVTPLGGVALIASWIGLAIAVWRGPRAHESPSTLERTD